MKTSRAVRVVITLLAFGSHASAQQPLSTRSSSGVGTAQISHAEKIYRLRALFRQIGLELPPGDPDFDSLQQFLLTVHEWAQSAAIPPVKLIDPEKIAAISYPSLTERAARSASVKAEMIQQPKTVQIKDPTTGVVSAALNPSHLLWKISSVTDYSQFVPTTSDIQAQAKTLHSVGVDPLATKALCGGRPEAKIADCVLRSGFRFESARVLSGFKGTFSWSENPKVDGNILVPAQYANLNETFSGQVDFDPTNIFVTGSDWSSAHESATYYGVNSELAVATRIQKICDTGVTPPQPSITPPRSGFVTSACIRKLAGPYGKTQIAALLVPKVTFVEKTNFDFVASNGLLIPNAFPSKRLADLTFSLDLTRLIPSAKSRQDALATLLAVQTYTSTASANKNIASIETQVRAWASEPEQIDNDATYAKLRVTLVAIQEQLGEKGNEIARSEF